MPEEDAKHKATVKHHPIISIMQATHRYYLSDAAQLGDSIMDPIIMSVKEVILFGASHHSS
jgi:hypothetical protein